MAYGFMQEDLFEINMELRCKVKAQKKIIEEFRSGERYLKLQKDHHKVISGYQKEIKKLRKELADTHIQAVKTRRIWMEECEQVWTQQEKESREQNAKIRKLEEENWKLQAEYEKKLLLMEQEYEEKLHERDCVIEKLKSELAHATALLERNSTNTSLPTGQTPPGKEKHIPNSRRSSGKPKGGQKGHRKHTLEKPRQDEVTDVVDHPLEQGSVCPGCGGDQFTYTGEWEEKYEYDIEVRVKKILHKYWVYRCETCGEEVRSRIDPALRADCQYGPALQAVALSLMNTSNSPINKVPLHLSGITAGAICPSEGYIAKLIPRAARYLEKAGFFEELYQRLVSLSLVYWDDTVVMADKKRICLRFYGDERIAYYVAHQKKDMESVLDDGVLEVLPEETAVMHDHNCINYNARFVFRNIECNAHIQRDLQKVIDETGHREEEELKELIRTAIRDRNDIVKSGGERFESAYISKFEMELSDILHRAQAVAEGNTSRYSGPFERALIKRLIKYRDNYFSWVKDFTLPTTNNLAERALRPVKTKMKVSGQFASVKTAENYAKVRTYMETCRRNGINEIGALSRLFAGDPYSAEEILDRD